MSNFNAPKSPAASVLEAGDAHEIRMQLGNLLSGYGISRGFHDESPHLSLLREVKLVNSAAKAATVAATLELLQEAIEKVDETDPSLVKEIVRFGAGLKDPGIFDLLARFALTFSPTHPLSPLDRQAVLGTLVDAKPPFNENFWVSIYNGDPANHVGMVASGLLATNINKAVGFYPEVIKSEQSCGIVTLIADLKWDELPEADRISLVNSIKAILPRCDQSFLAPLKKWVHDKSS
jgi:hypothetical protein